MKSHTTVRSFEEAKVTSGLYNRLKNLAIFIPCNTSSKSHTTNIRKFSSENNYYDTHLLAEKFDKKSKKFKNIFPLIYDKDNILNAWHDLKNKPYNLTFSDTKKAFDKLPLDWFTEVSDKLKHGTHKYAPLKQISISKPDKSGNKFLTIGNPRDKIIQKAFLNILEQIYEGVSVWVEADHKEHFKNFQDPHNEYKSKVKKKKIVNEETRYYVCKWIIEPRFHKLSFGFRPNRSPHLALNKIKKTWKPTWFWSADLGEAFDKINHNRLINELEKNISDPKLINEINKILNTKILKKKFSDYSLNVRIYQSSILSPFLFNVYMSPLDRYVDELKNQYAKKHELIPNLEFYKLQKQNWKEHHDKDFKTRIKQAKLFKNKAKKNGILPNLPRKSQVNIYYVRYADDLLFGFNSTKFITKKLVSLIANFIKSDLQLDCQKNFKLSHGRSELVPFLGFKIGLYPFKFSTKSKRITRLKKLKNMIKTKKVQEASLYQKMIQSISSQYHKRILEYCARKGENLLKISQIKRVNDNRIKSRVINALRRSLSEIELEIKLNPIGSKLKKIDKIKNHDSPFLIANAKRLNITRSIIQKWILNAQELISRDNLAEIKQFVGDFLSPKLIETRDKFLSIINKLESKTFSEKTLQFALDNVKSTQKKATTLGSINTKFSIRILLPTSELISKLRTIGIVHKTITRPKSKDNLTALKDYLIIRWFQQKALSLWNYYCCADNLWDLKKILTWIMRYSLLGTLAAKHKSSITKIIAKYSFSPRITYTYEKNGKAEINTLAEYLTPSELNKWKKEYKINSLSLSELNNLLNLKINNLS